MIAPVMICGFKRPECLARVMESVRKARVPKLYLVLDAPREGRSDDQEGYAACRKLFDNIDWPCEVKRNYAECNMGCGLRMTSGISWVLEHEDRVIVLEDDCVPDITFFRFCDELLEKYKEDARVGMIAGHAEHLHLDALHSHGASYYFDRMSCIWGWATWRRAWRLHDFALSFFPVLSTSGFIRGVLRKRRYVRKWERAAREFYEKKRNTWAGAWAVTMYKENMLSIHPYVNLIYNVGMSQTSRTMSGKGRTRFKSPFEGMKSQAMTFPLRHPVIMMPDVVSEQYCLADSLYVSPIRKILRNPIAAFWRFIGLFWKDA